MEPPKRETVHGYAHLLHDMEITRDIITQHEDSLTERKKELDALREELEGSVGRWQPLRACKTGNKVLIIRWVKDGKTVITLADVED